MDITINTVFRGGHGSLEMKVKHHGQLLETLSFDDNTGTHIVSLNTGLYWLSCEGVSPQHGTDISINHPTDPPTPYHIPEGPIFEDILIQI